MNTHRQRAQAIQLHQNGKLPEAITLYQQLITHSPEDSEIIHLYGLAHGQLGHYHKGIEHINQAIKLSPKEPLYYNNLGNLFYAISKWSKAIEAYQQSLIFRPDHIHTLYNLAGAYKQANQLKLAIHTYQQALNLQPNFPEAHNNLGEIYLITKQYSNALKCFEQALKHNPLLAKAYNNLGNYYLSNGQSQTAIDAYKQALKIEPHLNASLINLGHLHFDKQQYSLAIKFYQQSLAIVSDADIYAQKGLTYQKMFQHNLALKEYKQALKLNPNHVMALINIGSIYFQSHNLSLAKKLYRQAIFNDPSALKAYYCLASLLISEDNIKQARKVFEQAQAIKNNPAITFKMITCLPGIISFDESIAQLRATFKHKLESLIEEDITIEDPLHEFDQISFYLAYHGYDDLPLMKLIAQFFLKSCPELTWTAPHLISPSVKPSNTRIKIGFISQFFCNHSIGKFMKGVIGHLDRTKFEIFVFNLSNKPDDLSEWIKGRVDHFLITPNQLTEARQSIAKKQLDILFFSDAGLEPFAYFLAFSRLARIQCLTWGHGASSGIPNMDYFLSSETLESQQPQQYYSEKLVLMKNLLPYYYYPNWPKETRNRAYFGLSENKHLYICPHSLFKIHPNFDKVLKKILSSDPMGELILIEEKYTNWKHKLLKRFQQSMPEVIDRVRFVKRQPSEDFVSLISLCDVMLDTPYAGGGNTTYDTIFMGTPIVTWPSKFAHGRVTYACYKKIGVSDCIVDTLDEYSHLAIKLGTNKSYRELISQKIKKHCHHLYEDLSAVKELENIFTNWVQQLGEN